MSKNLNIISNNKKEEKIEIIKKIAHSYTDPFKSKEEKIILEKRRRHQSYMTLDYLLSSVSYFDFFSKDAFKIVLHSKYLAQIFNKKSITSELLFLSFFTSNTKISRLLKTHKINKKKILKNFYNLKLIEKKSTIEQKTDNLKILINDLNIPINFEEYSFDIDLEYSFELYTLFEKSAENSLLRFKTPVITSEILFITLMEEKNNKMAKFIKKILKTDINWYLLRYDLIKEIHKEETSIRTEIVKNQQFFGYLFKNQLTKLQFEKILSSKLFTEKVSIFRNNIIQKSLKTNLFELLHNDIHESVYLTNMRDYSVLR